MSQAVALNPVRYVERLNLLRRLAAAAIRDGEPFVYLTIRKLAAVSLRLRPAAVVLWCQQEAERLA